mgnify:CR=1 FL=1
MSTGVPGGRPGLVDWRRLLIAAPLLAVAGAALWLPAPGGGSATTPRAILVDTPLALDTKAGVRKGLVARDFTATAPDGSTVRLSDLRGKPTIINFWATWCASCLAEMSDLKAVQEETGADAFNVVAVNSGEDSAQAREFLDVLDAPAFRVAMDPTLVVSDTYGVYGLSHTVFVDKQGVIRATYAGQLGADLLRQYLAAATAGVDGADPPRSLRLLGNVQARRRVLEVRDAGTGRAEFRSKSLRCDDSFCSSGVLDAFAKEVGVSDVQRFVAEDPPRIAVRYDSASASLDTLTSALAGMLDQNADPLYEQPLEIERE